MEQLEGKCGSMSVIAMDREGHIGAATNLEAFPFVVGDAKGECRILAVRHEAEETIIFEPDQDWWKAYQGD